MRLRPLMTSSESRTSACARVCLSAKIAATTRIASNRINASERTTTLMRRPDEALFAPFASCTDIPAVIRPPQPTLAQLHRHSHFRQAPSIRPQQQADASGHKQHAHDLARGGALAEGDAGNDLSEDHLDQGEGPHARRSSKREGEKPELRGHGAGKAGG